MAKKTTSVYSKATALGFPYLRGDGKAVDGVWMSRFTKTSDGSGVSIYVGYDQKKKAFVTEPPNMC